jgi:hypothetical protein
MSKHSDLTIRLDFATVHRSAAHVRDVLFRLRDDFDLNQFEYCKKVRIAPTEIPHSHPEITLNTWLSDDLALLSSYLHEQMHWYVTWYSHACPAEWREIFCACAIGTRACRRAWRMERRTNSLLTSIWW